MIYPMSYEQRVASLDGFIWTDGSLIPFHMWDGLHRYIDLHKPTGGFLEALFDNDLMLAVSSADNKNQRAIHTYIAYLSNHAPSGCFGRSGAYDKWIEMDKC